MIPPLFEKMPKRPKKDKAKEDWEVAQGSKLLRKGRKITCHFCFKHGCNGRTYIDKGKNKVIHLYFNILY